MRNINTILLLLTGILCAFSACEAKCRGRNSAKLKRSLKLTTSSDKISNRHKSGLRKIFRRKRGAKDEEEDDVPESDKFAAEIKFLQKWNPAMSKKDGSVYRLFQGNVLDAVLEQMNADRRFINSKVLDLKKTPDGILAQVGFHFRKSEHNPVSHIRFVVSRGHLSSLKVDKHYFKILKLPANLFSDEHASKTSTDKKKQNDPKKPKQETQQNPAAPTTPEAQNEAPSAGTSSQTKPDNQQKNAQDQTQYPNQPQNDPKSQDEPSPQLATPQNLPTAQTQTTNAQNQNQIQVAKADAKPEEPKQQDQNTVQGTNQDQTQATRADSQPEQAIPQDQNTVQAINQDQTQSAKVGAQPEQQRTQDQNTPQVTNQDQKQTAIADAQPEQPKTQDPNTAQVATSEQTQAASQVQSQYPAQGNPQVDNYNAANQQQTNYPQDENVATYQPTAIEQLSNGQTTPNPAANAQTQNNDQSNVGDQAQPKPADNTPPQAQNVQENQKKQESSNAVENVSIKMNQAWFAFLKDHKSPQYKMLAGNLEKGLKSVMDDDKNVKEVKVKNLLQADEGHTTVEFALKFNGDKEGSTEKLRNVVKTGDIAGISVDGSFFKIEDNKQPEAQN